jgi:hypothetical protein
MLRRIKVLLSHQEVHRGARARQRTVVVEGDVRHDDSRRCSPRVAEEVVSDASAALNLPGIGAKPRLACKMHIVGIAEGHNNIFSKPS